MSGGGATVEIDGKVYQALGSTPSEFISQGGGYGLSASFAKRMLGRLGGDPAKLLPKNSSLSVTSLGGSVFNADSSAPQAVAASLSGSTMSWAKSASNDVVGYRVYDITGGSRKLISSIRSSGGRSITVGDGSSYIVVAVDITGLESAQSNVVTKEAPIQIEPTPPTTPPNGDSNGDPNGEVPDDSNPGNGNGNGNNDDSGSNHSDEDGDSENSTE